MSVVTDMTLQKVSREERLAKKEEEKIARKGAKKEGKKPAAAAAAGTGVTKGVCCVLFVQL